MLQKIHVNIIVERKAVICAIFIICAAVYHYAAHHESPTPKRISSYVYKPSYAELNITKNFSVFDTCNLTIFNHLHPSLLPFFHPNYNPKANCTHYEPLTYLSKGRLYLKERARNFQCKARCVFHRTDRYYQLGSWINLPSSRKLPCDIIETLCYKPNTSHQKGFLHSQIYEQKTPRAIFSQRPDVYLIILDSVSSSMAKRSLPKTINFLKNKMGGILMEFLNRVGRNSKPNGFALVFGKSIEGASRALFGLPPLKPDWNYSTICDQYLDKHDYHLHQFEAHGYKSMIAQDGNVGIVFYPRCLGFNQSEANHMWRPFSLRIKESKILQNSMERSCNERHIEMLDYMEQFIHSYPGVPKIAQIWPTALAHGTLNDLFHSDTHFLSFFQKNREKLENAFVFFMGDHGPWVTKITTTFLGRYEANNPFLLVTIPKRYRNTEMHIQLKDKSHQLMTNFDLHATLMDILQIQPLSNFSDISYRDMQPYSKGSSLLRIWRGERNCRTLPIPPQYCLCQLKWTEVRRRILEIKLGVFLAENLNKLLKKERLDKKCIPQVHHSTLQVRVRKDTNNDLLYDVRVYLHPSHGLFSAHIRSKSGSFVMDSGFKREDQYGTQGRCIFGSIYEPICQCRGQKHQGLRNEITRNLCKAPDLNV